jgi:hypothetical protein
VCAALGFGALFAGASVVFAVVHSPSASGENPSEAIPQASSGNQITDTPVFDEPQVQSVAYQTQETPSEKDNSGKDNGNSSTAPRTAFTGMITDARCGARHARNSNKTSADCATACVRKGSHYVLVDGEEIHGLQGDRTQLDRLAGMRVDVVGKIVGDTIKVQSIAAHHD